MPSRIRVSHRLFLILNLIQLTVGLSVRAIEKNIKDLRDNRQRAKHIRPFVLPITVDSIHFHVDSLQA